MKKVFNAPHNVVLGLLTSRSVAGAAKAKGSRKRSAESLEAENMIADKKSYASCNPPPSSVSFKHLLLRCLRAEISPWTRNDFLILGDDSQIMAEAQTGLQFENNEKKYAFAGKNHTGLPDYAGGYDGLAYLLHFGPRRTSWSI